MITDNLDCDCGVDKIVLKLVQERLKRVLLRKNIYNEPNINSYIDWASNTITLDIVASIYTENLGEVRIKYPGNWIEAFKERWFPKWLLEKYPVKYKIHRIDLLAYYPNIKTPSLTNETCVFKLKEVKL
jgi:hypothetical protein